MVGEAHKARPLLGSGHDTKYGQCFARLNIGLTWPRCGLMRTLSSMASQHSVY